MKRILVVLLVMAAAQAFGASYYVSQSGGADSNPGTQALPWQTLAKVNGSTFSPGDTIYLKRGDTWTEPLVPPSSGSSGNYITFDAYGSGPAPKITGYYDLGSSWTNMGSNVWKAPITGATAMNYVSFNNVWGQKQTSQANVLVDRDWYFSGTFIYVHAPSNPVAYYGGPIVAIMMSMGQLIYVNGKSWLRFQHLDLSWFDYFGVNVAGASDHVVFANMASSGMVPAGTLPHGFYVNASPAPTDIKFYNDDAHMNYDGFRFDGTAGASSIALVNCAGFANRDSGLVDNTGGVTYSYSHFYANNVAILPSQDVQGGTAGLGNIAADTDPGVLSFSRYPARDTLTVDDVGESAGTEAYINSILPQFASRNLRLSTAATTGYPISLTDVQNWFNAGHDVNSHSWSHQYYTNTTAMNMRYTGTGTAATLTISGNRLMTSVTGGPGDENLSIDLTNPQYDTMAELVAYINTQSSYTATKGTGLRDVAHSVGLADVGSQDIKTAAYAVQFDKQRLVTDEMTTSKAWLEANVTGPAPVTIYVYPDGLEDSQTESYAAAAGYRGARGSLSMGLGSNYVYSKGVNIQNIVSLGLDSWAGLTAAQVDAKIAALLFKQRAWGYPVGLFLHYNQPPTASLSATEVGYVLDSLKNRGALVMRNSELISWLATTYPTPSSTKYQSTQPGGPVTAQRKLTSPDKGAGRNDLGAQYAMDLAGNNRAGVWDIGAYQIIATSVGGKTAVKGTGKIQ